jgi:hypothetical protein
MDRLFDIGFLVLSQIAVGGAILTGFLDARITGKVLFKTNGILFLISMTLALILFSFNRNVPVEEGRWILILFLLFMVLLFFHLGTLWLGGETLGRGALGLSALSGLAGLVWTGIVYSHRMAAAAYVYLLPLQFSFSACLMGSGLVGMNLGHCYLTNIHLPISPYRRLSVLFLLFLLAEAMVSLVGFAALSDPRLLRMAITLESIDGLFFWIRVGVGFIAPLILIFMILHTVRLRSTQSATGLMYVAMMMVTAGEFFSRFFLLSSQRLL